MNPLTTEAGIGRIFLAEKVKHEVGVYPTNRSQIIARIAILLILFLLGCAPTIFVALHNNGVFNSPDETSRYLTAKAYAETGNLYIEDEITALNLPGPTGPRGFVQHNGRNVTIYPLGQPFLAGNLIRAFGDNTQFVMAIVPGIMFVLLGLLMLQICPQAPPFAPMAFIGVTAIWFWTGFAFLDIPLTLVFVTAGLLTFVYAYKGGSTFLFFLASGFLGLAALMRHQEAPFLLLLGLALNIALMKQRKFDTKRSIGILGVYSAAQLLFFIVPMAWLNKTTYGAPFTFGNTLFYQYLFPERLPESTNVINSLAGFLFLAFFPQPISVETLLSGIWNQIILMSPILFGLAMIGILLSIRNVDDVFGNIGSGLLFLALVYVLVSRSDPGTYGASATVPDIRSSLVRYFWPVSMAIGIAAIFALSRLPTAYAAVIVSVLVGLSAHKVWFSGLHSIPGQQKLIQTYTDNLTEPIAQLTEPSAVIYTGNLDKWLVATRRIVAFWQKGGAQYKALSIYNPDEIARSASHISQLGLPVYFLFRPRHGEDIRELGQILSDLSYSVAWIDWLGRGLGLWKLVAVPIRAKSEAISAGKVRVSWSSRQGGPGYEVRRKVGFSGHWGTIASLACSECAIVDETPTNNDTHFYQVRAIDANGNATEWVDAPRDDQAREVQLDPGTDNTYRAKLTLSDNNFAFWIKSSGRTNNFIRNSSFEYGLQGWAGPASQDSWINQTETDVLFGRQAMKMDLPIGEEGFRVRRTYAVQASELNSGTWTARARVRVVKLKNARIELRLIAKNVIGEDLRMRTVSTDSASEDDFQFLSVFETEPPPDTSEILVQLAMISLSDRGHGMVIWDGIELRPGKVFGPTYLHDGQSGAAWSGKPHMSDRYWEIDQPKLEIRPGSERSETERSAETIVIPGPFHEGETVQIMPGSVVVTGKSSTRIHFHDLEDLKSGDVLELLYSAPSIPRLIRSVDRAGS